MRCPMCEHDDFVYFEVGELLTVLGVRHQTQCPECRAILDLQVQVLRAERPENETN